MKYLGLLILVFSTFLSAKVIEIDHNKFIALCYHDVQDKIVDKHIMTITTDELTSHFKWLKENNYHPVSLDDILAAKRGEKNLPKNAVLLTFDDGYESFYNRIYPLLKLYHFPAVYALVTKWLDAPEGGTFTYGSKKRSRSMLLTWKQIKEMVDSGLVEMASHSENSHYGILANPQGNTQPKYTSLQYNKKTGTYESQQDYIKRVDADLKASSDDLYKHLGIRPRAVVWPYGAYNKITQKLAKKNGMEITLTLDDGINTVDDLTQIKRVLISNDIKFENFFWDLQQDDRLIQRPISFSLDEIYDPNPKIADQKLGKMIERILAYGANIVYIKPYADLDHDGLADALYFPNHTMPMIADLFNRVAWQLNTRAHVEKIYAWMPLSAYEIDNKRVSIYNENDKKKIKNIFFDMAKYGFLKAILFDDIAQNSYHDNTPAAQKVYQSWGLPAEYDSIKKSIKDQAAYIKHRREYEVKFSKELASASRFFTTELVLSRALDTKSIMDSTKKHFHIDSLANYAQNYQYMIIKTAPYAQTVLKPDTWLKKLVEKVSRQPDGLKNSVFLLKSTAGNGRHYLPTDLLVNQMNILTQHGALNFGYFPDIPLKDKNNQQYIKHVFSLHDFAFN